MLNITRQGRGCQPPWRWAHANARHERRTVVQNSARICIPAGACALVCGRGRSRATTRANRERCRCVRACVRAIGSNAWSARESNLDRALRVRFATRAHDEATTKQGRTIHAANDHRHYARVKESRVRSHAIRLENVFFPIVVGKIRFSFPLLLETFSWRLARETSIRW